MCTWQSLTLGLYQLFKYLDTFHNVLTIHFFSYFFFIFLSDYWFSSYGEKSTFVVCSEEADHRFVEMFYFVEALKSPPFNDLAKSGYRTLSQNICEFAKINEMPISLIYACSITQNFKELKRDISLPDVPCSILKFTRKTFYCTSRMFPL